MSEERTAETNGSKSFEERVFARFDAIDGRLDSLEGRILKLEVKQYDTRPIWEQALSAIAQINTDMHNGFTELRSQIATCATKSEMEASFAELRSQIATCATKSEMEASFAELRSQIATCATKSEMEAGFADLRTEVDFGLRGVERKIDALNHNILELHADRRYVDSRLEKLRRN